MQKPADPTRSRSTFKRMMGVAITLGAIGVLEIMRASSLLVPNPPAILLLTVVYAAFRGGTVPGLTSAAIAWVYFAYHFSSPGLPFRYDQENLARVAIWGVTTPLMALMVGMLHRRELHAETRAAAQRADAAIERGQENTRMIIEHALDAVVTMNEAGKITAWNPQAEKIFGWPAREVIGRSMGEMVIPERHRSAHEDGLARFLRTQDGPILSRRVEMDALHRDGHEFPVELAICALESSEGRIFSAFVRDITDRRAGERRQELMMRELDHRVKNNLAAVLAVLEQTAFRCASLEQFIETFRGRIMAMARLHSSLAATRWAGADLQTLVRQTLQPYALNTEGRVMILGEPVLLPASAVSAVCMALHELATNASKYGALSVIEGRVLVEWTREQGSDDKEILRLTWSESGGPRVEEPARHGFGRQLIEEGVPYELDGRTKLEFTPSGVTCELIVPLGKMSE